MTANVAVFAVSAFFHELLISVRKEGGRERRERGNEKKVERAS